MPPISLATSEIIKRRLFRAREHLQSLGGTGNVLALTQIVWSSYEFCRGLKLPAVRAEAYTSVTRATGDAIQNLTAAIDYDLPRLPIDRDPGEVALAAQAILQACHEIPLPGSLAAHHP